MNFCMKCESLYKTPGTCNCFAEARQPEPVSVPTIWKEDNTTLPPHIITVGGTEVQGTYTNASVPFYNLTEAHA